VHPRTLEPNAQRLKQREVTQMSKTKKLLAATLTVLALAAVPSTSVALIGPAQALAGNCSGTGAGGGC
jgi:hypothetical protein